ncbi:hypothetical protein ACFZAM_03025 [Streptomyces sp. NPDC008079]|uniref:hypothetical protein n=1 Tax=Streptomyces sp. NPDC008079 TaxID=3364806 RepID=UPI0036E03BDA
MKKLLTRRDRRASARTRRSILRTRAAGNRLAASVRRQPRSLATHLIASGVDRTTASGVATALRTVAKRIGIEPTEVARTRRTLAGGRSHQTRTVHHFTRGQVVQLAAAYKPRKAEYRAAAALLAA